MFKLRYRLKGCKSGPIDNNKAERGVKIKQIVRKAEIGRTNISGAKRRSLRRQVDDTQKKVYVVDSATTDVEAEGAKPTMKFLTWKG